MTGLTIVTAVDMAGRFTGGLFPVMAANTTTGYNIMIHANEGYPFLGRVALITYRHGLDMVCRYCLARQITANTVTGNTL